MISFRRALATVAALGLLAVAPTRAHADKDTSVEIYKQAKKKYNLGDFEDAIVLFKQAYDEFEAPAYLYNIAQAYRQLNNCPKSLFFYERFLAEKPGSDQEATIKGYVVELKAECGGQSSDPGVLTEVDDPIKKPVLDPQQSNPVLVADATNTTNQGDVTKPVAPASPRGPLLVATAEAGIAIFQLGDVLTPVSPSLRLGAAYPVMNGQLRVDAGVSLIMSTMAYQEAMGDSSVLFSSYLVNAAASYSMSEVLRLGGELGIGIFRFAGVEAGNPFTVGSAAQDASSTVAIRLGASAAYALSDTMEASFSPAFTYAAAHDALAADIDSVTNVQLLGGLRYRW